jgi:hypothetical protein
MDYNLASNTALNIGIGGEGSLPRIYTLAEGQDLNVGFLKIFVATQRLSLDVLNQTKPLGLTGEMLQRIRQLPQAALATASSSIPAETNWFLWDTIVVPIIVYR